MAFDPSTAVAVPDDRSVAMLRANPHLAPHFDAKHGKGAAHQALGKTRFVMCPPKYLSTKIPNNVFMGRGKSQKVDVPRAMDQYDRVKNWCEDLGVPVLEIPPEKGSQDQTFVANIGIA